MFLTKLKIYFLQSCIHNKPLSCYLESNKTYILRISMSSDAKCLSDQSHDSDPKLESDSNPNIAYGQIDELERDPNQRIAPWFGMMDIDNQRIGKKMDFQRVLSELDDKTNSELFSHSFTDIFSGKVTTGYRNKNKFTFGYSPDTIDLYTTSDYDNSQVVLGFIGGKHPGTFITDCSVACTIDDNFKKICKTIETIIRGSTIRPFLNPPHTKKKNRLKKGLERPPKHEGVWRYLTIRHSVHENMYMVTMTNFIRHITDQNRSEYNSILDKISIEMKQIDVVKSFHLCEYQKTLEPQPDDDLKVLYVKGSSNPGIDQDSSLREKILDRVLNVSPNSFFQVNTETTHILYNQIKEMFKYMIDLNQSKNPTDKPRTNVLIDMYCGTGSIGICVADMFDHIIGIDIVDACIDDAKVNAKQNGIKNCDYLVGRCEDMLPQIQKCLASRMNSMTDVDLYLLVDPAREGVHKRVRKFIKDLDMKGFVYCSCNVKTWATDVEHIVQNSVLNAADNNLSMKPHKTLIVDMFPHTQHYEVLSCFMK